MLFPWLSNIAINFDQYRFKRLTFHFKPAVPTITPGTVYLYIDPDVYDPQPLTPAALMNNSMAVISSVFLPVQITLNAATKGNN